MADYTKENYLTAGAQPEETTAPTTPSAQDNSATTPLSKPTAGADRGALFARGPAGGEYVVERGDEHV